jgi:hypothetical protein
LQADLKDWCCLLKAFWNASVECLDLNVYDTLRI